MVNLRHSYCIFSGKMFTTPLPHFCRIKKIPRDIAARLPHLYRRFTTEQFYHSVYHNFCHTLPRTSTDKVYHEVYHKVYHIMVVDVLSIFEQKCEGFNSHLGGIVDSVVFWARFDSTPLVCECLCANHIVSAWGGLGGWFVENRIGQVHVSTQSRQHDQNYRKHVRACIRRVQTCFVLRQTASKVRLFPLCLFFLNQHCLSKFITLDSLQDCAVSRRDL